MMLQQDPQFKSTMLSLHSDVPDAYELNLKINHLGMQYFKAAQTAEKLIDSYAEIKMDTQVSLQRRKAMHESMVIGIQTANQKELVYKNHLEAGTQGLEELTQKIKSTEEMVLQFEEQRCRQCHSSINQFVVFEKYAEMNNKYDVKNFSEIIEQFDLEAELKTIAEDIESKIQEAKVKCQ